MQVSRTAFKKKDFTITTVDARIWRARPLETGNMVKISEKTLMETAHNNNELDEKEKEEDLSGYGQLQIIRKLMIQNPQAE